MSIHKKAILDASYFDRLRLVDPSCDLTDYISEYTAEECVVDKFQYQKCMCGHRTDHGCGYLQDLISDTDIFRFYLRYPGTAKVEKIFSMTGRETKGDFVDIKILATANSIPDTAIFSCDSILLALSKDIGVPHYCFKASMIKLCLDMADEIIFESGDFTTDDMFDAAGTDPFFHYSKKTRCQKCSGNPKCIYGEDKLAYRP